MARSLRQISQAVMLGAGFGMVSLILVGVPTAVIPNQWFRRMTPTRPQDYVFLTITAVIAAAIGVTYAYTRSAICPGQEVKMTAGGMLSFVAIGCPICNKLVVMLLGVSGALRYFAPVQPLLGLISIALLGFTLVLRLRAVRLVTHENLSGA